MGSFSIWHWVIVLGVVFLFFGHGTRMEPVGTHGAAASHQKENGNG